MMRTSPALKLLALFLLAHAGSALAQTRPSDAPPKLERIEEGSDTPVTIVPKRDQQRKIKETKDGGQVKEVQVTSGKSTYTMKGSNPASVAENSVGTGSTLRPPQWKVLEFDLSNPSYHPVEGAGRNPNVPSLAGAPANLTTSSVIISFHPTLRTYRPSFRPSLLARISRLRSPLQCRFRRASQLY